MTAAALPAAPPRLAAAAAPARPPARRCRVGRRRCRRPAPAPPLTSPGRRPPARSGPATAGRPPPPPRRCAARTPGGAPARPAAWPPAGQGRRGSPGPGSGPTRPRRGRPTPAPPPRRGPACGWRPGPGRRGPARSRAAVLVAQRLEQALVSGEVLLEQPDEALVLAALLDQMFLVSADRSVAIVILRYQDFPWPAGRDGGAAATDPEATIDDQASSKGRASRCPAW